MRIVVLGSVISVLALAVVQDVAAQPGATQPRVIKLALPIAATGTEANVCLDAVGRMVGGYVVCTPDPNWPGIASNCVCPAGARATRVRICMGREKPVAADVVLADLAPAKVCVRPASGFGRGYSTTAAEETSRIQQAWDARFPAGTGP